MKVMVNLLWLLFSGIYTHAQMNNLPYNLTWSELPSLPPVGGQAGV